MEPSLGRSGVLRKLCYLLSAICYSDELQASLAPPVAKYLFINYEYPPIVGGSATACQQIARAFVARGHQVVVLTSGIGSLNGSTDENSIEVVRLRTLRKKVHQSGVLEMLSFVLAASLKAVSIGKAHQIDF